MRVALEAGLDGGEVWATRPYIAVLPGKGRKPDRYRDATYPDGKAVLTTFDECLSSRSENPNGN